MITFLLTIGTRLYKVGALLKNKKIGIALFLLSTFVSISSFAQTYKWGNVAFGGGGFVSGLVTCKSEQNLMYARTDVGGAYRWNASTSTWTPLLDWCNTSQTGYQGVLSFAIDPTVNNNLYLLVGTSYFNNGATAILRSSDYGKTFSVSDVTKQFKINGNSMGRNNGERLQVDPNNSNILYCGSQSNGLFKSDDAGISWAQVASLGTVTTPNGNGINCVIIDSTDGIKDTASKTLYVFKSDTGTNFYRSDDAGISFIAVPNAPATLLPQRAVLAKDHNLYITYADNEGPYNATTGQIWKYNTHTGSWTNVSPTGIKLPFSGISVDPNNPLKLIASTINVYQRQFSGVYGDKFYLSTDGGITWRDLIGSGIKMNANGCPWFSTASIHWAASIEFDPFNTDKVWVCSGNGVFFCNSISAATNTWYFGAKGIEETVPLDIVSIPNGPLMTVVGDYDGFKNTDPALYGTRFNPAMGSNTSIACAALNTQKLVRIGNKMYYTNNQGASWTQCASIMGTGNKVALSADGSVILHCPDNSTSTYRSINNGTNWTACTGIRASLPVADPVNPSRFYAYNSGDGNMYTSIDGGVSFTVAGAPGVGGNTLIRTAPDRKGHLWVAMNNGGLKRSIDSGATYAKVFGVTACSAVGLGKADSLATYYTIYIWGTVSGITGVFRSTNLGATWTRVNDDAHQYGGTGNGQFIIGDFNIFGRVYQSTVGRGVAYADLASTLPIKLISFIGSISSNQKAILHWQTADEIDNDYFDVERSVDGNLFSKVGTVIGKFSGGVNTVGDYSFVDDINTINGVVYYRLKQVGKNGNVTFSSVIRLANNKTLATLISVYPNPTSTDNITVHVQISDSQKVAIRIVDMAGKICYNNMNVKLLAGANNIKINSKTALPKGIYLVKVMANQNASLIGSSRFVITK